MGLVAAAREAGGKQQETMLENTNLQPCSHRCQMTGSNPTASVPASAVTFF